MTLALGTSTVSTFLIFWLCFDEHMKNHGSARHPFIVAPIFIFGIVLGLIALVAAVRSGSATGKLEQGRRKSWNKDQFAVVRRGIARHSSETAIETTPLP